MLDDRVIGLTAFVHVADLERSIAFYETLGLEVRDRFPPTGRRTWVYLDNGREARLMLTAASAPIDATAQAVLFYTYVRDLDAFRDRVLADGIDAGPIRDGTPGPRRELALDDPDGYRVMVAEIEPPTA